MAIYIKNIILVASLFILVFTTACTNKTEVILEIIYQDTVVNFTSESSAIVFHNTVTFHYDITNTEKQNVYVPMSFFHIQSSIFGSNYITSYPENTFIFNTINIYPRNTELRFITEMNKGELTEYMPFFIRIKPFESLTVNISFPIVYINNGIIEKRLLDTVEYTSQFKIAIIKHDKFINILKVISLDEQLEKFVVRNDTLNVNSHVMEKIIIESFPLSEIKIDEFQSLVINEMCNVKFDIICDIDKKITEENTR